MNRFNVWQLCNSSIIEVAQQWSKEEPVQYGQSKKSMQFGCELFTAVQGGTPELQKSMYILYHADCPVVVLMLYTLYSYYYGVAKFGARAIASPKKARKRPSTSVEQASPRKNPRKKQPTSVEQEPPTSSQKASNESPLPHGEEEERPHTNQEDDVGDSGLSNTCF